MITETTAASKEALRSCLHANCVLCGAEHAHGLRLAFAAHADGHVEASFPCDQQYQGYTGYLHGGVIAALLDSAMTNCLFTHGRVAMTGELKVRFLKPVIVNRPVMVSARLDKPHAPLFKMSGEVRQLGELMARATAKFVEVRISNAGLSDAVLAAGAAV